MSNVAFSYFGLLCAALIAVGLIGLFLTRRRNAKTALPRDDFTPITSWKPTGHIDFIAGDDLATVPAPADGEQGRALFYLRVEDYRILESISISGAKRVEYRWRNATLTEAKQVVVRHNADITTIDDRLPYPIRGPKLVPEVAAPIAPAPLDSAPITLAPSSPAPQHLLSR